MHQLCLFLCVGFICPQVVFSRRFFALCPLLESSTVLYEQQRLFLDLPAIQVESMKSLSDRSSTETQQAATCRPGVEVLWFLWFLFFHQTLGSLADCCSHWTLHWRWVSSQQNDVFLVIFLNLLAGWRTFLVFVLNDDGNKRTAAFSHWFYSLVPNLNPDLDVSMGCALFSTEWCM